MVARVGKNGSWNAFGVPAQIIMDASPTLASEAVSKLLALFGCSTPLVTGGFSSSIRFVPGPRRGPAVQSAQVRPSRR